MSRKNFVSPKQSPSHKRAPEQESEWAAQLKGRKTLASGSLPGDKGDVVTPLLRIECKTTSAKSFSVTREMVQKIETEALSTSRIPGIVIEFNDNGKKVMEVAVVPTWVFQCPDEER